MGVIMEDISNQLTPEARGWRVKVHFGQPAAHYYDAMPVDVYNFCSV